MDHLRMHSADLTDRNIEQLAELFPTVVTESRDEHGGVKRAVDFDLLRQELSDHVVDGPQERYQLDWPGKREALFTANAPIAKTLRPQREESVDFDTTKNLFIEGDNLEALKLLQESYLGKVKLIYIDPPYNTGHDFVYNDSFAQSSAEYLERSGQEDEYGAGLQSNPDSSGRFHSDWLSMMYPRLKLSRSLLRDDGYALMSIDDTELAQARSLCEEIFGPGNFIGTLIHQRAKGGGNAKNIVKGHDYILVLARNAESVEPLRQGKVVQGRTEFIDNIEYLINDDIIRKTFGKYESGTERRCLYEEIETLKGPNKRAEIDEKIASGQYFLIPWKGGHIVASRTPVAEAKSKLYSIIKVLSEEGGKDLEAIEMEGVFSFPKPADLMAKLVEAAAPAEGDIIVDLFAGSGSTAEGIMRQSATDNRKRHFIAIQVPEDISYSHSKLSGPAKQVASNAISFLKGLGRPAVISEITKERVRRAGNRVSAASIDTGFRALRIDTTNMADTLCSPDDLTQGELAGLVDNVKPGRTGEDLLFQVMLEWGLELSLPIAREEIDGSEVFSVDDGALLACFGQAVSPSLIKDLATQAPLRVVFRDSAFANDSARVNAEQVFAEVSPSTDVKVI